MRSVHKAAVRIAILSCLSVLMAVSAMGQTAQPVAWVNVVNAITTGANNNGLQKNGGCEGCIDSGANSQQTIASGDGYVEFTVTETTTYRYVGLSTIATHDYHQIHWAINVCHLGIAEVREDNNYRTETSCTTNDVFRVAVVSGVVKYSKNGNPLWTSATAPSYPLYADASLLHLSSSFSNAMFSTAASSVPTSYSVETTRNHYPKAALPALGPVGTPPFLDPTFSTRILRVTDGNTRPGALNRSYTAPSAAHAAAWNKDSTYFYLVSGDGTKIPYQFNAATMTASRIQPSGTGDGGLVISSQAEPVFSLVSPKILYGTKQDPTNDWPIVEQIDFSTTPPTYTDLLNLGTVTTLNQHTYGGVSSSAASPEKIAAMFGGDQQDAHDKVAVFQVAQANSTVAVLDTWASTIKCCGLGGTTSPTNITLHFHLHHVWIDQSGRYVVLYTPTTDIVRPRCASPKYVWDTSTNLITAITTGLLNDTYCDQGAMMHPFAHDATGYGVWINHDCCTSTSWSAAQWQFRALNAPATTADLINPILDPPAVQHFDDHVSWNNAQASILVPILSATYRNPPDPQPCTTDCTAWDEEIIAIQTSNPGSSGTVWRFANHRANILSDPDPNCFETTYFRYQPIAVISQDGRWAIFHSNWEKQLGLVATPEACGKNRTDVFVVELPAP